MNRAAWSLMLAGAVVMSCCAAPASFAMEGKAPPAADLSKSHAAKDLYYKQTVGLRYSIELIRDGQSYYVDSRFPFRSGDQIRFHVQPNVNGFMYVDMISGSTGSSARLFPDESLSDNNRVSANPAGFVIPQTGSLEFDNNPGMEHVQLVLSRQEIGATELNGPANSRSIKISAKPGETKIDQNCYIDVPATLSTGNNKDASQLVTLVSTDHTAPLRVDLVLRHDAGDAKATATTAIHTTTPEHRSTPPGESSQPSPPAQPTVQAAVQTSTQTTTEATPSPADSRVHDKWALVVGISKFKDPQISSLLFAAKDAKDFANFLVQKEHFAADHVKVLTNDQATRYNVGFDIAERQGFLPSNVKPGDMVVIYIASHASGVKEDDFAAQNFLITHDTDVNALSVTGLDLQELGKRIKLGLEDKTDRVMLVLDTCHSGAAKSIFIMPKKPLVEVLQGTGRLVLAACQPEQVAFDSTKFENGLFTRCLMDALAVNPTVQSAFDSVKQRVEQESEQQFRRKQTPVMKSSWQGSPLVLSVEPAQPRVPNYIAPRKPN